MAGAEHDDVEALRQELARERRELAVTVNRLERSAARVRRRVLRASLAVAGSVALAVVLAALLRVGRRRHARPRERVVARFGDLVVVKKGE